jgi:Protein of unknown function (DUF3617)
VKKIILTGIVLAWPLASWAADVFDIKPALWEATMTTEMQGMPAQPAMPPMSEEQLAKIPPAQRAQIEAMMKGRGGLGSPQTTTTKVCHTRESLANAQGFARPNSGCTSKVTSVSAAKMVVHMDCTGQFKGSGDMTVERVDSEHSKGNFVMKTEGEHSVTMKMSFTSRFLSSDCGDVKPVEVKK